MPQRQACHDRAEPRHWLVRPEVWLFVLGRAANQGVDPVEESDDEASERDPDHEIENNCLHFRTSSSSARASGLGWLGRTGPAHTPDGAAPEIMPNISRLRMPPPGVTAVKWPGCGPRPALPCRTPGSWLLAGVTCLRREHPRVRPGMHMRAHLDQHNHAQQKVDPHEGKHRAEPVARRDLVHDV